MLIMLYMFVKCSLFYTCSLNAHDFKQELKLIIFIFTLMKKCYSVTLTSKTPLLSKNALISVSILD